MPEERPTHKLSYAYGPATDRPDIMGWVVSGCIALGIVATLVAFLWVLATTG